MTDQVQTPVRRRYFGWKFKLMLLLIVGIAFGLTMLLAFPRAVSIAFSYKKECKVLRVEPFMKGVNLMSAQQMNKFSLACEDGFICRANDTGFAAVKAGDVIEFRGYPEFSTIEEWGKCDNARLIRIIPGH